MAFVKKPLCWFKRHSVIIGVVSLAWFLFRTGLKPSRYNYPCQQAARNSVIASLGTYFLPMMGLMGKSHIKSIDKRITIASITALTMGVFVMGFGGLNTQLFNLTDSIPVVMPLRLTVNEAKASSFPSSNIFVVNGTTGNDGGLYELINLIGEHGQPLFNSQSTGSNSGPNGLIAKDDIVIIKVNSQWNQRGGTNTDLLRELIQILVEHPDGWSGEIVVADNGQLQYGMAQGGGGSFTYTENNAEDQSQSVQKVVDSFTMDKKVSTYLWDRITTKRVSEFTVGDIADGYVVEEGKDPATGLIVSYPKFTSKYGTFISFKLGVWNPDLKQYDSEKVKVINMPVLKSHGGYGVTACVKHYMGVPSDKLTSALGSRTHSTIGEGSMGALMGETRMPVLNILDCIWINAKPRDGPYTTYSDATRTNMVIAGIDPVAVDYWASKYVLTEIWRQKTGETSSAFDPENQSKGSFGYWLRRSMEELNLRGYPTTNKEAQMNVYLVDNSKTDERKIALNVQPPEGSGSTDPATASYIYNSSVTVAINAIPSNGWILDHWILDNQNVGSINPYIITMDRNHTIKAVFNQNSQPPPPNYRLTIQSPEGSGSTDPAVGTYTYNQVVSVSVKANALTGWMFDHWVLNEVSVGNTNPYTLIISANHQLKAVFKPIQGMESNSPLLGYFIAALIVGFSAVCVYLVMKRRI